MLADGFGLLIAMIARSTSSVSSVVSNTQGVASGTAYFFAIVGHTQTAEVPEWSFRDTSQLVANAYIFIPTIDNRSCMLARTGLAAMPTGAATECGRAIRHAV